MRFIPADAAEGPRSRLLALVREHPGTHLRGLERLSGLPLGQVLYHLDRLERMQLLTSSRDCGFRRYYATGAVARAEKKYLAALRHQVPMRILLALLDEPNLSHRDLQTRVAVAGSTLSFHLARLVEAGVLERRREGPLQLYRILEPELLLRDLVEYRASFDAPEVQAFVDGRVGAAPPIASRAVPMRM